MSTWGRSPGLWASTAVALVLAVQPSVADPTNPNVVGGDATVSAPAPGTTLVDQATPRAIIEWDTFDVGVSESVIFSQPSGDAIALNRVTGGQGPSAIDGRIDANGRIIITNQDGIVFGDGAVIDVGALIATTADIENDPFMNGSLDFNLSGSPDGQVINRGSITARDGGLIALVAPHAENAGVLSARVGRVAVAGGDRFTIDFTASEFLTLAIDPDSPAGQYLAQNSGEIAAEGGHVLLTTQTASDALSGVVNNSGIVEATAVDTSGGRIRLVAGGGATVTHSGTAVAQGTTGGTIEITAERVELTSTSVTDASGEFGGGTILIGGDYLGGNAEAAALQPLAPPFQDFPVYSASLTFAEAGAEIRADAYTIGDGGQIIMWANDFTHAGAEISARGGESEGNGGFVETSGGFLDVQTTPQLTAANGAGGTWLIDPYDIDIVDGFVGEFVFERRNDLTFYFPTERTAQIGVDRLLAVLENGVDLVISTNTTEGSQSGNITIEADIERTSRFDSTLTLFANRDIIIERGVDITSRNAEFGLNLIAEDDIRAGNMGDLELNGGRLALVANDDITLRTDSRMPDTELTDLGDTGARGNIDLEFDDDRIEFYYTRDEIVIPSGGFVLPERNVGDLLINFTDERTAILSDRSFLLQDGRDDSFEFLNVPSYGVDEDDALNGLPEVINYPSAGIAPFGENPPRGVVPVVEVSIDEGLTVDVLIAASPDGVDLIAALENEPEMPVEEPVEEVPPVEVPDEEPVEAEEPPSEVGSSNSDSSAIDSDRPNFPVDADPQVSIDIEPALPTTVTDENSPVVPVNEAIPVPEAVEVIISEISHEFASSIIEENAAWAIRAGWTVLVRNGLVFERGVEVVQAQLLMQEILADPTFMVDFEGMILREAGISAGFFLAEKLLIRVGQREISNPIALAAYEATVSYSSAIARASINPGDPIDRAAAVFEIASEAASTSLEAYDAALSLTVEEDANFWIVASAVRTSQQIGDPQLLNLAIENASSFYGNSSVDEDVPVIQSLLSSAHLALTYEARGETQRAQDIVNQMVESIAFPDESFTDRALRSVADLTFRLPDNLTDIISGESDRLRALKITLAANGLAGYAPYIFD